MLLKIPIFILPEHRETQLAAICTTQAVRSLARPRISRCASPHAAKRRSSCPTLALRSEIIWTAEIRRSTHSGAADMYLSFTAQAPVQTDLPQK